MSENPPADYIELNLVNYDGEDVAQLNSWAIWAVQRIEDLEDSLARHERSIPVMQKSADALVRDAQGYGFLKALDILTNWIRGNPDLYPVAVKIADMRREYETKKEPR